VLLSLRRGCGWLLFDGSEADVNIIVLSAIFVLCVLNACSGSFGGVGGSMTPYYPTTITVVTFVHPLVLDAFFVLSSGLEHDWSEWNNLNLIL
jgi:hypothetical protein